ncbi:MAG: hypothetical protein WCS43_16435, partial [Verrucomicrobiota bacterium]
MKMPMAAFCALFPSQTDQRAKKTSSGTARSYPISLRKSRTLHRTLAATEPLPRILRAPSLRFFPNRSRAAANASLTKLRLPITAPSVKYLTRH